MSQPALSLEVLRAEHGDCLLLHHGNDVVLTDGGPSGVYKATLKPRLQELIAARARPLFLQMVMVSHIDDDHIVGLADMFAEAVDRKENKLGPPEWAAGELWLNAFGALTGASPTAGAGDARGVALNDLATTAPGQAYAVAHRRRPFRCHHRRPRGRRAADQCPATDRRRPQAATSRQHPERRRKFLRPRTRTQLRDLRQRARRQPGERHAELAVRLAAEGQRPLDALAHLWCGGGRWEAGPPSAVRQVLRRSRGQAEARRAHRQARRAPCNRALVIAPSLRFDTRSRHVFRRGVRPLACGCTTWTLVHSRLRRRGARASFRIESRSVGHVRELSFSDTVAG